MTAALAAAVAGVSAVGFSLRFNWWRPRRTGTPILMYHQISRRRGRSPLDKWRVSPEAFERQLDHLVARGIRGVALRDLLEDGRMEGRRAVLTFDDGFADFHERALPLLAARHFTATVFVVSDKVGGRNDWDDERPGDLLLGAGDLRELHRLGMEIGSHGATHRPLTRLDDSGLERETTGSRERLQEIVGEPVVSFCYPYGSFDERVVASVRRAGYRAATVIRGGISPDLADPFRLKRIAVRGTDTLLDFRLALTRGRSKL